MLIGGLDHLSIVKTADAACARIELSQPASNGTVRLALDRPRGFGWEHGGSSDCTQGAVTNQAIGALGSIKLRWATDTCVLDVHMTMFVLVNDVLTPVRFDADGVAIAGLGESTCL